MYVLTIVFLVGRITLQSLHADADACERLAARARSFDAGPQAVLSATCAPQPASSPAP